MAFGSSLFSMFKGREEEMPQDEGKDESSYKRIQKEIEMRQQQRPSMWQSMINGGGLNLGAMLNYRNQMNNYNASQNQGAGFGAGIQGGVVGKPSLMGFMNRPQQGSRMVNDRYRRMY